MKKNLNRFLDTNKKWSKGRSKSLKDVYYKFFSTSNWVSLDEDTKSRHTIDCKECLKFSVQTNYPTVASKTEKTKKNLKENLVAGVSDSLHQSFIELDENNLKSKKTCNEFTTELCQAMDTQFSQHFGVNFQDTYKKNVIALKRKWVMKIKEVKRLFARNIVNNIKQENSSTSADRLYGGKLSKKAWERERKKKIF